MVQLGNEADEKLTAQEKKLACVSGPSLSSTSAPAFFLSLGIEHGCHGWCRHQLVIKADEKLTAQEKKMAEATRSLAGQLAAGQQVPLHLTIHNRDSSEVETMDFSGAPTPEVCLQCTWRFCSTSAWALRIVW